MFVIGNFFSALAFLVDKILLIMYFLLFARIILSWFQVNPYNELVQILYKITEPILSPFRRIPLRAGMFDLTPILAFLALWFLRLFLVSVLMELARRFAA